MIVINEVFPDNCFDCWFGRRLGCRVAGVVGWPKTRRAKRCPIETQERIMCMTTNEFETLAKKVCVKVMKEQFGIELSEDELQLVWFAHELGYKKCTLYAQRLGHYYPEITYNWGKDELYVDVYLKQSNTKFSKEQMEEIMGEKFPNQTC